MSAPDFRNADLLAYLQSHRLAVVSTLGPLGEPQAALVGIGCTDSFEIIFDTLATTRKHRNLQLDDRIAAVLSGPGERTVQLEGVAKPVSPAAPEDAEYREMYYRTWPEGRDRLSWSGLVYWRIVPSWARYSDFEHEPCIREFRWPLGE
jgi:hypothetical protein